MERSGKYQSPSPEATLRWGEKFALSLTSGSIVFLIGSLGVGKTTLTKGLARGLGYTGPVNSPSFTLMRIYQGKFPIYHCDLYRLQPGDNLRDLGIEEILEGDNIAIFEWSERFPFVNSLPHWEIALDFTDEDDERIIAWKWVEVAQ